MYLNKSFITPLAKSDGFEFIGLKFLTYYNEAVLSPESMKWL